jgi:hypothetical protein
MNTQYTREEVGKMLQWAVFITGVILFVIGIFAGLSMGISSPECSERETTTEVYIYECIGYTASGTYTCSGSSWNASCYKEDVEIQPICERIPYEKQIIKEIKK